MILKNERPLDAITRHLREANDDLNGWKNEMSRPKTRQDSRYAEFCQVMISICENTISALGQELEKWRED